MFFLSFVFFFKQKTAYEMRISDWSSDVCSSDLDRQRRDERHDRHQQQRSHDRERGDDQRPAARKLAHPLMAFHLPPGRDHRRCSGRVALRVGVTRGTNGSSTMTKPSFSGATAGRASAPSAVGFTTTATATSGG